MHRKFYEILNESGIDILRKCLFTGDKINVLIQVCKIC